MEKWKQALEDLIGALYTWDFLIKYITNPMAVMFYSM